MSKYNFVCDEGSSQGTSWLELLALFELNGGCVEHLEQHLQCRASGRLSLGALLARFRKVF